MSDKDLVQFDRKSAKRIARAVKRVENTPHNRRDKARQWPGTLGRDRWFGITATCDEFPTYPPEPPATADTYCVRLLERFFAEVPGDQTQTEIQDNRYVVARLAAPTLVPGQDRRWLPEGTEVEVYRIPTRRGPRYYCRPLAEQERLFELAESLVCGEQASAYLLLGEDLARVAGFSFDVFDRAHLVGNLNPDPHCEAEPGTRGVAKWFHDRRTWDIISLGMCVECESSSSSSPSSSSPSSSSPSSSSPSSSDSDSDSESSSDDCDYTGSITVGRGNLHRVGDEICQDLLTLRFEAGKLCDITDAGEACAYVCCDSDSSSPSSSSPSSSDESSSSPSSSSPSSSDESSSSPSSSEPSSSDESSSSPSSSEPSSSDESSSSSSGCVGECTWVAEDDDSSDSSDATSSDATSSDATSSDATSSDSSCGPCDGCQVEWECILDATWGVDYMIWSRRSECTDGNSNPCATGCKWYYPNVSPSYVGEIVLAECGCGCGNCGFLRVEQGWAQLSGCADFANCKCFDPTGHAMDLGEMTTGPCTLI